VNGLPIAGVAASLDRLGTETAFGVLARAKEMEREGRSIIHLELGEPDFDTPSHIGEAAIAAIRDGHTRYTPAAGIPEFRKVVADHLSATRGIAVDEEQVLVAPGAKPFIFFTILATCDPGDEVIYPDPGFPIYHSAIRWSGAVPVPLPLREDLDFAFDPEELRVRLSTRSKLVILNSPHNPTGGLLSAADVAAIAAVVAESNAWVLSDEVYSRLCYDGDFASVASHGDLVERTVVLDGLSKTYAMTGWRCGYAAVPRALFEPLERFLINSTSCVPAFVQLAGVSALTGPQGGAEDMRAEFRHRRHLVVEGLNELPGVSCRMPGGAFYAFPNVTQVPLSADELARRLLEEAGVAVLAGSAFGEAATGHLRVSYANSRANLVEALGRMSGFLDAL
jgi:aspartate/methionine/tyrosine aminotransferase